jgi:hypothetical protein
MAVASAVISVVAIALAAAYFRADFQRGPTSDEFAVYEIFLDRLSRDWSARPGHLSPDRFALADTTLKLVQPGYESWLPAELRPYPPEKADPPASVVAFCGRLCGYDFKKKNLRSWNLRSFSNGRFRFEILPTSAPDTISARRIRILTTARGMRVVSVTRPGFDLWHNLAVLDYGFDCGRDGNLTHEASMCLQSGQVRLEQVNGTWRVVSYSGMDL